MKRNLLLSSLTLFALATILAMQIGCATTPNDCLIDAIRYQAELPAGTWSKILCIDFIKSGYSYRHYVLAFEFSDKVYLQDSDGSTNSGLRRSGATPEALANMFYWLRKWTPDMKITRAFFVEKE